MELSIRDWMWVIGVLLFLAVALDGYRRARRERKKQVRLSNNAKRAARKGVTKEDKDDYPSELPGGGARVVSHRQQASEDFQATDNSEDQTIRSDKKEPTLSIEDDSLDEPNDPFDDSAYEDSEQKHYSVDPLFTDPFKVSKKATTPNNDKLAVQPSLFDADTESPKRVTPQEIISLNVLASNSESFAGEDLLHILLACDCRFGEMNIFHRYESENAKGEIQFSIVNVVEPGVFKLDDIKNFTTPGVSFFLCLPGPKDPIDAFNCMVETAQCLVRNLKGKLTDEGCSTVTEQTLEHCRQRIQDFLKKQLVNV